MGSTDWLLRRIRHAAAGIVAALAAAAVAYLGTVLLFFAAGGAQTVLLIQLLGFFFWTGLIFFVLLAVAASVDGLRHWYVALPLVAVIAVLSALLGSLQLVLAEADVFDGGDIAYVFGTLLGHNLVFVVAAVLSGMLLARLVWSRIARGRLDLPAARDRRIALVRLPASTLADGELTHLRRVPIDLERADAQWDAYVATLTEEGWDVIEVPVAPDAPDSVFVEDTVVIFGETAVIASPGAESRRGETAAVAETVRELGLRVAEIRLPGTLDGGDVLKVDRTVYVGRGGRTNAEGIRQLREIVGPLGYRVVAVPIVKALHLKSAVTALPDGTVIGWEPHLGDARIFERFLGVPEEAGSAVVVLDPASVLLSASAPRTAELIRDLGYRVVTVEVGEFEKLEGCVTCLSVRLR